jgi:hypothetical protein
MFAVLACQREKGNGEHASRHAWQQRIAWLTKHGFFGDADGQPTSAL